MKDWEKIFKALGNVNRLNIIKALHRARVLTVTNVADQLKISFKATSKHLNMLKHLDMLQSEAKYGQVYYSLNPDVRADVRYILRKVFGASKRP